jgi:hypothetical protein
MEEQKFDYDAILMQSVKNPIPSESIKIEGVGSIEVFGEWDIEKLIKKLLEYEEITG